MGLRQVRVREALLAAQVEAERQAFECERAGVRGVGPLLEVRDHDPVGLLRAVEGFDPAQGARFSTYASWWIKQSIKRALINASQPIHIPAYMVELIAKWKVAARRLEAELGFPPSLQDLAKAMDLPVKKVRIIRRAVRAFHEHALHRTREGTGVLIFAALFEHQAVVLGDRGIDEKMGQEQWQRAVDALVHGLRRNDPASGFCSAIEIVGGTLERHFPRVAADAGNELDDTFRSSKT